MSVQVPTNPVLLQPETANTQDAFLIRLLNQGQSLSGESATELESIREAAAAWVKQQRMPTKRDEEWRFTDLSPLSAIDFTLATSTEPLAGTVESFTLEETVSSRLVFVNGRYSPDLSTVSNLPDGVFVGNLAQLPKAHQSQLPQYFGQQFGKEEVFTALNTAGCSDVAVIWVNPNVVVESSIQLLFLSVAEETPTFFQPRVLVVAKHGASLTLVEQYVGAQAAKPVTNNGQYFTNAVTEIWLEEDAQVNHNRVQQESEAAFHIGKTTVTQARDSRYTNTAISLGGQISRHNLDVWQTGEQTTTYLYGLSLLGGEQVSDTHSSISLTKPYGSTDQLHKCIIDDRANAVFNGKVFVPKAAQLTNAAQLNRNLLLSPKARVNTKPELQITADNVKCSHGATVSQLEPDEVFYLRSRGLSESDARHLLIDAFANEILEQIPLDSLRQRLSEFVVRRTSN